MTSMSAAAAVETPRGFTWGIWRVWGLIVWVVPLALFALRFFNAASGFETLAAMLYLPIWYPVLGGLGMAPKWIWAARADKLQRPPAGVFPAMLVHWVGLLVVVLTFPGQGDGQAFASPLGLLIPAFAGAAETPVAIAAAVCSVAGLLLASVVASVARVSAPQSAA